MKITFFSVLMILSISFSSAQNKGKQKDIILSVNAYSFADLLTAREPRDKQQVFSYFNLLDWCATQNIKALDATAYFFPTYPEVPSDEYLEKFKNHAKKLGIAISGTGVRNNFASPDPKIREEGVKLTKSWIVAAAKIGAPVVRVFDGAIPKGYEDKWEEPAQWMIACYKECAEFGAQYGVKVGIQNHGEMLQTAAQCKYILEKVNSKWVGLILDTGNFKTADPYKDIAEMVPFAINWQVKESVFGIGSPIRTDFKKLMKIIIEGGYKGYLPVETLLVRGESYDPFSKVPAMLKEMEEASKALK
ncbi:sugar phosphate isomerase/epimerase [Arcicella rosea]|uniref:sugar phosphate isomerase/epimerase family protein n=1 Tax=Arcicella rosea TaxID=502909 RepID=UPI00345C9A1A